MERQNIFASPPPVAIVGAGPVGLSLAIGLARQGVRSVVFERKPTTSERSKAPGIHVRTREVFRQWGIDGRFQAAGVLRRTLPLHNTASGRDPLLSMDFSELDDEADQPGVMFLEQGHTERLLLEAARESGLCEVRFDAEVIGLSHDATGVRLRVRAIGREHEIAAAFVIGCDGAGSFVRNALELPFEGITYSTRPLLADVRVADGRDALPWPRVRNGKHGYTFAFRLSPGLWRIVRFGRDGGAQDDEPSHEELSARVDEVLGPGVFELVWASRFRIHVRASPRFRVGRVLLAGDAAHVHSPAGGFGMNGGIQDTHNLAWKLANALKGGDADRLLDSYDVERRAVIVESVSRYTDLNTRTVLQAPAFVRSGMFLLWRSAFKVPRLRRMGLRRTAMLDLDYPASPLLQARDRKAGVRLPNPALRSPDGSTVRLYDLLPTGPVLLEVAGADGPSPNAPETDRIRIGPGGYEEPAGLLRELMGEETGWILVRPDAHVAWARSRADGLDQAVRYATGLSG